MVHGHMIHFLVVGWTWKNSSGEIQFLGTRNQRKRLSHIYTEPEAQTRAMECMLYIDLSYFRYRI